MFSELHSEKDSRKGAMATLRYKMGCTEGKGSSNNNNNIIEYSILKIH
jgi:hypothetical protein